MNLLTTIFGGMVLTALLYGAMRLLRTGNFWSAVAAAGLPTLAYLVYAALSWPGLDVVMMHLMAFPTVAVVLALLYDTRRAQRLHWAPKLIVALFLAASLLYGGLVHIASHGLPMAVAQWFLPDAKGKNVHTGFAGVVPHYQEAAKGIGQQLRMEDRLARLGWRVEVVGLDAMASRRGSEVSVFLAGPDGQGIDGAQLGIALAHPGQRPDRLTPLAGSGQGGYRATLRPLEGGTWVAYLVIEALGQHIALERTVQVR